MESTVAAFQLTDYYFSKVTLDSALIINNDINISFDLSGVFSLSEDNKISNYKLTFETLAKCKDSKSPFITVECIADFSFEGVSSLETIPDYFYQNSIAILFPYIRAYVSLVTNQANIKPIILPTLNLTKLSAPLKENTTVQQ